MVSIQNLVRTSFFNQTSELTENELIAKEILRRYPPAKYSLDAPIYRDLTKIYQNLSRSTKKGDLSKVLQTLSKYGIPTSHLKSIVRCKEFVGEILKIYGLQKANDYITSHFPFG